VAFDERALTAWQSVRQLECSLSMFGSDLTAGVTPPAGQRSLVKGERKGGIALDG
jgi:hypothetical protein